MEAVGFAASISSLLEFSGKVIAYIKDVKDENEERYALINELTGTKAVLSELENKADSDEWRATMEALMTKNGPRDQFKSVLECLEKNLGRSGSMLPRVAKWLIWPFTKRETKEILLRVERAKSFFVLALANKHL